MYLCGLAQVAVLSLIAERLLLEIVLVFMFLPQDSWCHPV